MMIFGYLEMDQRREMGRIKCDEWQMKKKVGFLFFRREDLKILNSKE